ncbi:MAG: monofunctional biosynthetic peptidoglycan transglycosylase [Hyphomicrobium sp.]
MDRSDQSLEEAFEPQTVRTVETARPMVSREPGLPAGGALPPAHWQQGELAPPVSAPAEARQGMSPAVAAGCPIAKAMGGAHPQLVPYFELRPAELLHRHAASVPAAGREAFPRQSRPIGLTKSPAVPAWILPFARTALKAAGYAAAGWVVLVMTAIVAYRYVDPPVSALMLQRRLTGEGYQQTWVPIEAVSPQAVRAVLVAEDGRFCQHWGVDVYAIESAIERAGEGTPRGASTISMQVAKNLFLWPSKSYVRKVLEVPLTFAIETVLPKKRILEIYLNIAEWGPGVFGIEAAAQHHFAKPAFRLSEREAAQLAVSLPNPLRRDAGDPGPGTRRLAGLIQARARAAPAAVTACVQPQRSRL